jgi:hypothetical protein
MTPQVVECVVCGSVAVLWPKIRCGNCHFKWLLSIKRR